MPPAEASAPEDIAVIVTGAARGMGRAMTLGLAAAGVRVAAVDLAASRDAMAEVLDTARQSGMHERIFAIDGDIARPQDCEAAVRAATERFGAVHGLVNNAGIAIPDEELLGGKPKRRRFYEHAAESWRRVIDTNVNGSFQMARAVAPQLVAQGWGRIVVVTTSHATMVMDGFAPYGPSKAALEASVVIWSKDLAGTGVTVNALVPGGPGNTRMVGLDEGPDRSKLVQPEMMIAPIVWLMSPGSDGVTGRRFIARNWDTTLAPAAAAEKCGAPAGW